jgi:hypothetical protein
MQSRLCLLLGNPMAFAVVALRTNGGDSFGELGDRM